MSSSPPSTPETQRLELVGRITATVAHDLNNVLTALLAYADFARDESSEPAVHAELDELVRVGRRASALTRQLLQLARRDDGPLVLDLGARIGELAPTLRRLLPLGISLRVDVQPDALVRIVSIHVDQIVLNLVLNARDAVEGEGTIAVHVEGDDTQVVLEVRDDGRGMSPEVATRAFEPAFSTKPPGLGTGLGLSTCRALAIAAGGSMELESEPGRGTTVRVRFPRSHDRLVAAPAAPPRLPELRVDGELAVLLEDDRTLLDVASRMLQSAGFRVVATATRERFERALVEHRGEPRVIVVSTASLDPRHVLGLRTRLAPRSGLLLTGLDRADLVVDGERSVAFVAKPFTAGSFVEAAFEARALARDAPSLRVLLADPHGDARALLSALLRRAGHDVVTAPDVARAEASLAVTRFDLVLASIELDWRPTRKREAPWIGLTSSDDPDVVDRAIGEGYVDVLVKPLGPRVLSEAIEECTSKYRWVLVVGGAEASRVAIARAIARTPNARALWVEGWAHAQQWLVRDPFDLVLHATEPPADALSLVRDAGATSLAFGSDPAVVEREVLPSLGARLAAPARRPPSSRSSRRAQLSVEVSADRALEVASFLKHAREQVVSLLAQLELGEVAGPIAIARDLVSGAERYGLEVVAMLASEAEEHQVEGRAAEARMAVDRLARYLSSVRGATMRPPP